MSKLFRNCPTFNAVKYWHQKRWKRGRADFHHFQFEFQFWPFPLPDWLTNNWIKHFHLVRYIDAFLLWNEITLKDIKSDDRFCLECFPPKRIILMIYWTFSSTLGVARCSSIADLPLFGFKSPRSSWDSIWFELKENSSHFSCFV